MMKKRTLSLLLALVMCAGLAVQAFAAEIGPSRFPETAKILTSEQRDAEREKIARSIRAAGGTVMTEQETPTDPSCQERLKIAEEIQKNGGTVIFQPETPTNIYPSSANLVSVKGTPDFRPEEDKGAYYYVSSDYNTAYTELFTNVRLPSGFNNANRRNGYLCVGAGGALGSVDLGLQHTGDGWRPYYWDAVGRVGGSYPEYVAPPEATNAKICAKVMEETQVYLFIQFLDASGAPVGKTFSQYLSIGSGNFTFREGRAVCRYFRFASLVPKHGMTEDRKDGSFMWDAKFTNCQLYNGTAYEGWGIPTARTANAWKVCPEEISLTYTDYHDIFTISHP